MCVFTYNLISNHSKMASEKDTFRRYVKMKKMTFIGYSPVKIQNISNEFGLNFQYFMTEKIELLFSILATYSIYDKAKCCLDSKSTGIIILTL